MCVALAAASCSVPEVAGQVPARAAAPAPVSRAQPAGSRTGDTGAGGAPADAFVTSGLVAPRAGVLIASARRSVDVEMYEFGDERLVSAATQAERRGIAVRVVLDFTEPESRRSGAELSADGVPVRYLSVPGAIDHVKLLLVDGTEAMIGGVNWGASSSGTTDADVVLARDPGAEKVFGDDWAAAGDEGAPGDGGNPGALSGPAIGQAIVGVIAAARSRVLVVADYLSSYDIQDALVAAARRGVTVDALMNPDVAGAGTAASWLSARGVSVRWAPRQPYLHAKLVLADRTGVIGSANFSFDGLDRNHELDAVVPPDLLGQAWEWAQAAWAGGRAARSAP